MGILTKSKDMKRWSRKGKKEKGEKKGESTLLKGMGKPSEKGPGWGGGKRKRKSFSPACKGEREDLGGQVHS